MVVSNKWKPLDGAAQHSMPGLALPPASTDVQSVAVSVLVQHETQCTLAYELANS